MSATISIKDLYEPRLREYEQLAAMDEESLKSLRTNAARVERELSQLRLESSKKQDLQTQARDAKLDTRPLEDDLRALAETIRQKDVEREQLQEAQASWSLKSPAMKPQIAMLKALQRLGHESAVEVGGIADCCESLTISLTKDPVEDGGPTIVTGCEVQFVEQPAILIPFTGSSPVFDASERPSELSWVPIQSVHREQPTRNQPRNRFPVWFEKPTGRVIVSFDVRRQELVNDIANSSTFIHDVASGAVQLHRLALEELEATGGKLDLSLVYAEGSFLAGLKSRLGSMIVPKPRFPKSGTGRDVRNVAREFQGDWLAFVQAPWSGALQGAAAILKYTLENGERPRFWHQTYDNHYGFRVRTRDHTWIEGYIFIDQTENAATDSTHIAVRSEYSSTIKLQHGRMHLFVCQSK